MRSLFPMLLKCHQHLHPIVESKIAKQNIDVDINLDIFEMSITYDELVRKLVNMELLFFKHYHVDICMVTKNEFDCRRITVQNFKFPITKLGN
jgi:hypothetical protein